MLFEICKPCGLKNWIKTISEIWPLDMYIWHVYSGNEAFGNLFLGSKYLAVVDSSFLHLCLIRLLQSCVLILGSFAPMNGIQKDVEAPSGFSHTEDGCGNHLVASPIVSAWALGRWQIPQWALCTKKEAAQWDLERLVRFLIWQQGCHEDGVPSGVLQSTLLFVPFSVEGPWWSAGWIRILLLCPPPSAVILALHFSS